MSTAGPEQQFLPPGEHRHETSDVSPRGLFIFLAMLVIALMTTAAALAWFFRRLEERAVRADPPPSPLAAERSAPPGPHLQVSPRDDLAELRTAEEETLGRLEWINRQEGVVQIPIERAMEIVAQRGLPYWPKVDPAAEKASESTPRKEQTP
jgi:hypothetical protein